MTHEELANITFKWLLSPEGPEKQYLLGILLGQSKDVLMVSQGWFKEGSERARKVVGSELWKALE